jgi:hypothetical protein
MYLFVGDEKLTRPLRVVRVNSKDGDSHFVFLDPQLFEKYHYGQDYDEIEVKKASKKEASRPLILKRTE